MTAETHIVEQLNAIIRDAQAARDDAAQRPARIESMEARVASLLEFTPTVPAPQALEAS